MLILKKLLPFFNSKNTKKTKRMQRKLDPQQWSYPQLPTALFSAVGLI